MKYIIPVLGLIIMAGCCSLISRGGYGVEAIAMIAGNSIWTIGARRWSNDKTPKVVA